MGAGAQGAKMWLGWCGSRCALEGCKQTQQEQRQHGAAARAAGPGVIPSRACTSIGRHSSCSVTSRPFRSSNRARRGVVWGGAATCARVFLVLPGCRGRHDAAAWLCSWRHAHGLCLPCGRLLHARSDTQHAAWCPALMQLRRQQTGCDGSCQCLAQGQTQCLLVIDVSQHHCVACPLRMTWTCTCLGCAQCVAEGAPSIFCTHDRAKHVCVVYALLAALFCHSQA